jgi:cytochrome c biogenesis protein CcmG/thiol:disulfide interchange protein DsbE
LRGLFAGTPRPFVPEIGRPAPPLRLPLAGGGEVDLAALRGKVVLINFWATWCTPCRAEMPAIERAYQAYRGRGFEVLAVDVQEREGEVAAFLKDLGVTFPSAIDRTGEAVLAYRANALPTTFLIDREGIMREVRVGPFTEDWLDERLRRLLAS